MLSLRSIAATVLTAAFTLATCPTSALAAQPQLIGTFKDWSAFTVIENGAKVCYMASRPLSEKGDYTRRDPTYTIVTHRPAERSYDVVTVIAGYPYKSGSETTVKIDNKSFELFTDGENAWAETAKLDAEITQAIRRGAKMVVQGRSSRGTLTTDVYSLAGSSDAYDAISRACPR